MIMFGNIFVKIENGKIIKTDNPNDLWLDWDGEYYLYYGEEKYYNYKDKTYDCFPIVYINRNLTKIVDMELFGCEKDDKFNDSVLWGIPVDKEFWDEIKIFENIPKLV